MDAVRLATSGQLHSELVPRTMLSLAYLGRSHVWMDEMETLVGQVRNQIGSLGSLRAVDDVGRALRLCRHRGDAGLMTALDARGRDLLETERTDFDLKRMKLAASVACNVVYAGVIPEQIFASMSTIMDGRGSTANDVSHQHAWDRNQRVQFLRSAGLAVVTAHRVLGWQGEDRRRLVSTLMELVDGCVRDFPELLDGASGVSDLASLHPFLLAYYPPGHPVLYAAITAKRMQKRKHTVSTFQRELFDVLNSHLGIVCVMEGDVRGVSVDILLESRCVAVEADGASHFYRNGDGLVPASRLKSALVEEGGVWRMVHVDQREWDAISGREARGTWLRKKTDF